MKTIRAFWLLILPFLFMNGCSDEYFTACEDAVATEIKHSDKNLVLDAAEISMENGWANWMIDFKIDNVCGGSSVFFEVETYIKADAQLYFNLYVEDKVVKLNQKIVSRHGTKWCVNYGTFTYEPKNPGKSTNVYCYFKFRLPAGADGGGDFDYLKQNFKSYSITFSYLKLLE